MLDRPIKFTKALSQGSEASLIVLTTYFHGVRAQLNNKINNLRPNKNLDYFHVQILVILSTHTRQLTLPLSISQSLINTDESSFEHFIEHLVGVRENSKFEPNQVRLRP